MKFKKQLNKDFDLFMIVLFVSILIFCVNLFYVGDFFKSLRLFFSLIYFFFVSGYLFLLYFLNDDFKEGLERFFISLILNIVFLPLYLIILNIVFFIPLSFWNILIFSSALNLILVFGLVKDFSGFKIFKSFKSLRFWK